MGAELVHADRQTDIIKLIVDFRDFANAPKNKGKTSQWGGNNLVCNGYKAKEKNPREGARIYTFLSGSCPSSASTACDNM
jgi:hypothetical protein